MTKTWQSDRADPGDRRSGRTWGGDDVPQSDLQFVNVGRILTAARRQLMVLALSVGVGVSIGIFYLIMSPPGYSAVGQVLVDPSADQLVMIEGTPVSSIASETDILNRLEVLRSSHLALEVVEAESLATNVQFLNPPPSFMGRVRSLVVGAFLFATRQQPEKVQVLESVTPQLAADLLRRNVVVERSGRSFVINLGFRSYDPDLAQRVANAYATAFVQDQLNTNLEASRTAADWFQGRLAEISQSQQQATEGIESFRRENGLPLQGDQEAVRLRMESLSQEQSAARNEVVELRSQIAKITDLIEEGQDVAAGQAAILTGEGVDEAVVASLRTRRDDIQRRIAEVIQTFGADHPQVAIMQAELNSVDASIFGQFKSLLEYYRNRLGIAESRFQELSESVERESAEVLASNQARAQLGELQQRSQALAALYNSFSSRYEELLQRQSFPIPTARVISAAARPGSPYSPSGFLALAGGLIFGLFAGGGLALANELRERSFRLGSQVSKLLRLRFVGYFPRLSKAAVSGRRSGARSLKGAAAVQALVRRAILTRSSSGPSNALNETLRSARRALDASSSGDGCRVVGVVSVLPGEGKTMTAIALADMLAASGAKVLLLDSDQRQRAASTLLAPKAQRGLFDVMDGVSWSEIVVKDSETGLMVLPAGRSHNAGPMHDVAASPAMKQLFLDLQKSFDYVIVDLPPLGPAVDALVMLQNLDSLFLVINWGQTPRRLVQSTLDREPVLGSYICGVILNNVDFNNLPNFSEPDDPERFLDSYRGYYRAAPAAPGK